MHRAPRSFSNTRARKRPMPTRLHGEWYRSALNRIRPGGHDEKTQSYLMIMSLPIAVMSASAAQVPQHSKQPTHTITNQRGRSNHNDINFQHRNASTTIDFQGTPLMPAAGGQVSFSTERKANSMSPPNSRHSVSLFLF
jgi:hypothetical protein